MPWWKCACLSKSCQELQTTVALAQVEQLNHMYKHIAVVPRQYALYYSSNIAVVRLVKAHQVLKRPDNICVGDKKLQIGMATKRKM
jgi:hypothetical protein